jgi:hypothetical protein
MASMTPKVENMFDLISRVYYRALLDAGRGDAEAVAWLDICCPDWRERTKRGKAGGVAQHGMGKQKRATVLLSQTQNR